MSYRGDIRRNHGDIELGKQVLILCSVVATIAIATTAIATTAITTTAITTPLVLLAGRVTGNAILIIRNAFFTVLSVDLGSIVAGKTGPLIQGRLVTGATGIQTSAMVDREGVRAVELCRPPSRRRVTGDTIQAEEAGMEGRFPMTSGTGGGKCGEIATLVTTLAGNAGMGTSERELG